MRVGILAEDDVGVVGQPLAGFDEAEVEVVHHQVDGATVGIADVTLVRVLAHVEVEAGVTVVVEGTKRFVVTNSQPKSICYTFNRKLFELLNIESIKHSLKGLISLKCLKSEYCLNGQRPV